MRRRIANGKQRNINRAEDGLEPIKQASGSLLCPHGHGLICTERKTERTGAVTGDPAASSHNANPDTTGMGPNKSRSGTSTSGGSDANGDQGRDKKSESNMKVKPRRGSRTFRTRAQSKPGICATGPHAKRAGRLRLSRRRLDPSYPKTTGEATVRSPFRIRP
jgi:hypothetical protein